MTFVRSVSEGTINHTVWSLEHLVRCETWFYFLMAFFDVDGVFPVSI